MSREIPEAIRAFAGLAATVVDEARRLPETLPGLPVRLIGLAMQATMKLQQHYSGLVARGDEVFTGLRGESEPGMATFDEDLPPASNGNGFHSSAFDRAAEAVPDEDVSTEISDEEVAEEAALLIDDELSGLPPEPAPEEVVEALQDITDQVAAAGLADAPQRGLSTEDALETALLEADGAPDSGLVDGGTADAGLVDLELIAESPTTAPEPAADLTADVATEVDVLTADGEVTTVEGTVTDEGVAAPESADEPEPPTADAAEDVDVLTAEGEVTTVEGTVTDEGVAAPEGTEGSEAPAADAAADQVLATDEGGTPVAAATGGGTATNDGDTATDDRAPGEDGAPGDGGAAAGNEQGSAGSAAPIDGYDTFTVAQLRGRLRGYQYPTVRDLLAYEEATRARGPFLTMLRNRLEKLDQQAADASPLAPRGI